MSIVQVLQLIILMDTSVDILLTSIVMDQSQLFLIANIIIILILMESLLESSAVSKCNTINYDYDNSFGMDYECLLYASQMYRHVPLSNYNKCLILCNQIKF